jgi:predicted ester cyclase
MRFEVHDEICEGDRVAARVTMHGHHLGEFLGKPPSGKEFGTKQIHIWRIEDGKVIDTGPCATTSARRSSSG